MSICFVSDLHVDCSQPPIKWPEADVLAIAGDIANSIGAVIKLCKRVSEIYDHVVMVDGNHESYCGASQKRTIEQTIERIILQLPTNVYLLGHHNPKVKLDDVNFIGCNGWYSCDALGDPLKNRNLWRECMNDNENIGFDKFLQSPPWERAITDAKLIEDTILSIPDGETIVCMTHTAPHRDMLHWTNDYEYDCTNSFYMNRYMQQVLESDTGQRVAIWQHGHTHFGKDKQIGSVYCVCNPRGYPTENPKWQPVVIDI